MISKRTIGLHLRLDQDYASLTQQALNLGLTTFQFFLVSQKSKNYLTPSEYDVQEFLKVRHLFGDIYIHTSYWINLASGSEKVFEISMHLLAKEIALAKQLQIKYLVLHPGAASRHPHSLSIEQQKNKGMKSIAHALNTLLKDETDICVLLENNMHGGITLGSDLQDFRELQNLITVMDKVRFCIDTAHAFSYGYDLAKIDEFVALIDQTMGLDNLKLIHLNDSDEKFGNKKDKHKEPGAGYVGKELLQQFMHHPKLEHLPIILEISAAELERGKEILATVSTW